MIFWAVRRSVISAGSRAGGSPLDGAEFVPDLKRRLTAALGMFNTALADGTTGGVRITTRPG
jgi:hypothetical protein